MMKKSKLIVFCALATGALLLIPLVLQLTIGGGFNWHLSDFIAMGILLFATSTAGTFATTMFDKKYRGAISIVFLLAFLWLWAELAVGIFTNWGS